MGRPTTFFSSVIHRVLPRKPCCCASPNSCHQLLLQLHRPSPWLHLPPLLLLITPPPERRRTSLLATARLYGGVPAWTWLDSPKRVALAHPIDWHSDSHLVELACRLAADARQGRASVRSGTSACPRGQHGQLPRDSPVRGLSIYLCVVSRC